MRSSDDPVGVLSGLKLRRGAGATGWPCVILWPNDATCFGAGLGSKPLRKCRAETNNTETKRREDDQLCHGEPLLSDQSYSVAPARKA